MGGQSTSSQTQSSSTSPWAAATPTVNGLFGAVNNLIPNSGVNSTEQNAINQLTANGQAGNPYASAVGNVATGLLGGGGAQNTDGMLNNAYQQYVAQTQPLASNTDYNPYNTPGIGDQITSLNNSISNGINSQFAASGRFGSGSNGQSLAQGLVAGEAPILTAQYNQNVQNQQAAAQGLYGAGNATASALGTNQANANTNAQNGITAATAANTAQQWGPQQVLAAQELGQSLPAQNLGLLAQIGIPLAGLGTTSTGQSTGTQNESGAQQFGQIAGGIGSLGGLFATPGSAAGGGTSAIGGLLSLLSDRRLKEDICRVGALFDGTPVYRYRYIGQPVYQIGLMAQDVERHTPEAVRDFGGYKAVEYKAATERAVEAGGC